MLRGALLFFEIYVIYNLHMSDLGGPKRPELDPAQAEALGGMGEAADQLRQLGEATNSHVSLLLETLHLEARTRETQRLIAEAAAEPAPEPEPAEDPRVARARAAAEQRQRQQEGWSIQRFLRALPMAGYRSSNPDKTGPYDPLELAFTRPDLVAARALETEVWWTDFASVFEPEAGPRGRLDQPSRPGTWNGDLWHSRPGTPLNERALPTFVVGQQITLDDPMVEGDAVTLLLAPAFPKWRSDPRFPEVLLKAKLSLGWFEEAEKLGMEYFLDPIENEDELSRYPHNDDGTVSHKTPPAGHLQHVLSVGLPDTLPPQAPRALTAWGRQRKIDQARDFTRANGLIVAPASEVPYEELDAGIIREFNMGYHAMRLAVVLERSAQYDGLIDTFASTIAPLDRLPSA
jgi:hypothetical protein